MSRFWIITVATLAGLLVGSSVGIAAFGGAINGALPFGAGLMILSARITKSRLGSDSAGETSRKVAQNTDNRAKLQNDALEAADGVLSGVGRLGRSIWNLEMHLLRSLGLMTYFVRAPWLLLVLGIALLVVIFPIGSVFFLTWLAALAKDPGPENEFMVVLR